MNNIEVILSIGMPVYNGEKFIREALDSLLAQTFSDFELVVSDNASTDGTEAICREYAERDQRIRYVRQAENFGAIANFKFVLDAARGKYFMWAAADDVWDKGWVEALLPISVAGQCLAYGTVQTIDGNGNHMQHPANRRRFNYAGSRFVRRLKYYSEPSFLGKPNPIYGICPKSLLAKEAFSVLALGGSGADVLFLYRLLADADIKGGTPVFLYKRIHNGCVGVSNKIRFSRKRGVAIIIFEFLVNVVVYQYRQIIDYGSLSNLFERFMQIIMSPFLLVFNIFYLVINNPRFNGE